MTTHAEISGQQISAKDLGRINLNWLWGFAAVLTAIILVSTFIIPNPRISSSPNYSNSWEIMSARYTGLSASALPESPIKVLNAYNVSAARYQGLADHYAQNTSTLHRSQKAMAARYQGQVEETAVRTASAQTSTFNIMTARYQGLADRYNANNEIALQRSFAAMAARYEGLSK